MWLTVPHQSAPVYDGLCLAAPYKYLGTPPPGVSNGGTPGRQEKTDVDLTPDSPVELNTDDDTLGPALAQVNVPGGSLTISSPTTVHAVLEPVPEPTVAPASGYIIGNVYRISLTASDGREIPLRPGAELTLYLLPSKAVPGTRIERLDGGRWTVLSTSTTPSCTNTLTASSDRAGVFALVDPNPRPASYGGRSGSEALPGGPAPGIVAVLGGTIGLLLCGAVAVRLRRRAGRRGGGGTVR